MNNKIFLDNKYKTIYYSIIERAKTRLIESYKENHHIIPKCFFEGESATGWLKGDCDENNTVNLTAREHFIAHWLLIKMQPNKVQRAQMVFAFNMMSVYGEHQERYETAITSRAYEKYRIEHAKNISKTNTGRVPWNKGRKETRKDVLENIQKAALARPAQTAEQRENQAKQTRGQKRTAQQKNNISKSLKGKKKGPMSQKQKDAISAGGKGIKKSKKMGKRLSSTISKQLAEGTHNTQIQVCCLRCRDVVSQMVFGRNHRDKWHS